MQRGTQRDVSLGIAPVGRGQRVVALRGVAQAAPDIYVGQQAAAVVVEVFGVEVEECDGCILVLHAAHGAPRDIHAAVLAACARTDQLHVDAQTAQAYHEHLARRGRGVGGDDREPLDVERTVGLGYAAYRRRGVGRIERVAAQLGVYLTLVARSYQPAREHGAGRDRTSAVAPQIEYHIVDSP